MENDSRMALEVNKLINGKLLSSESIYMPEVGTLYVETTDAVSKQRKVRFSDQASGSSLVDVIQKRANCNKEQAQDVYNRWLAEVKSDKGVVLAGIGEICAGLFVASASFESRLNPQPVVVEERKKDRGAIWMFIVLGVVLLIVLCFFGYQKYGDVIWHKPVVEEVVIAPEPVAEPVAKPVQQTKAVDAIGLRYKLVFGVFREQSNIETAKRTVVREFKGSEPKVYPFAGNTSMVVVMESDSKAECQSLLMSRYEEFPEMWVYEVE